MIVTKTGLTIGVGMPPSAPSPAGGTISTGRRFGSRNEELPPILAVYCSPWQQVEITELQPAGKKRMTAEEFLRGHPIQDGYRFGPERLA